MRHTKTLKENQFDECVFCGCWLCKNFTRYDRMQHSFKVPFIKMWFWFPRFLWKKTYKGVEGKNEVFKLWHGFYIWPIPERGAVLPWKWWKIIKFKIKYLFKN